jgi:S1-C subfamily serine protease
MTTTKSPFLAGILGGLVVAIAVGILLATGVIETGNDEPRIVRQTTLAAPDQPSSAQQGKTVSEIYDEDGPGVAFIQTQTGDGAAGAAGAATGSGFVLDTEGYILTNAHVVEGAKRVQVSFNPDTGDLIDAKLIGSDPSTDLALLKIDPKATKLRPLRLGDSDKANVGDPVVAIGNPFGYSRTVTHGIVSAKQRRIEAPNGFQIDHVIQTDAAINPGNSGGPLIDAEGRVIGINSQIATGGASGGSIGIGFAVPVNTAKTVVPQLKKSGHIDRAYLGITSARITEQIAKDLKLPADTGALVQSVVPGGPADKAGIRGGRTDVGGLLTGGDLITEVDGRKIENPDDIAAAIADNKPGDKITVKFLRGGKERQVTVTLGKRPDKVPGAQAQPQPGVP